MDDFMNEYDGKSNRKNISSTNRFNSNILQPPINSNSKRAIMKKDYDDFYDTNSVSKSRKKTKGSSR